MDNTRKLPLIPLRGLTIFPNMVMHFDVGREKSKMAITLAMEEHGGEIFLAPQKDIDTEEPKKNEVCKIGTIAVIKQVLKLQDDVIRVLVEGKEKGKILKYKTKKEYIEVEIEELLDTNLEDPKIEAYLRNLKKEFSKYMNGIGNKSPEMLAGIEMDNDPSRVCDLIAGIVIIKEDQRREVLEIVDVKKKLKRVLEIMAEEINIISIQNKIAKKVKDNIDKSQKEYYLREQMKIIREELDDENDSDIELKKLEDRINDSNLPSEVREKVEYEFKRLKLQGSNTSEASVIRTYIEWVLDIPWNVYDEDNIDIQLSEEIINKEHYGLDKVKERIIEFLAVKKVSGSMKGPILCLEGPPGVGKTSIVKSIAESMNRQYVRIALGGVRDESEIRGHRKTYVGAIPGRIAYALKDAKTMNPVILLDEIDKISSDYKGDPADALLELLDPEQNSTFRDSYLELSMDLSKALFITTANNSSTIPRPLLDRMELIELSGYTYEEKFHIAKNHLIPNQLKEHNVNAKQIKILDDAIKVIISGYTIESGVRSLKRTLGSLIRKALTEMIKNDKKSISITEKKVEALLGPRLISEDINDKKDKVGIVTGLAWTSVGGTTLEAEAITMPGTGKIEVTGKLGDVMQESAKAAFTYVRANAKKYGIDEDFYKKKDVHIHFPEAATPKDGPSAGVTMTTALVSALSGKKVRHNVAMTGEVTITGRVMAIGGLKEKALAAARYGIDTIIIPKENEKNVKDIPESVRKTINIIPVERVDEVLEKAIIGVNTSEN